MSTNRDEVGILSSLPKSFAEGVIEVKTGPSPELQIRAERIAEICRYLESTSGLEFNYLINLTAVDWVHYFELVYHLQSIRTGRTVTLKAHLDHDDPVAPSVADIWAGADFQERETYDLFGIRFSGHPDLKRILLYDEFEGHPLRKDYGLPREEISRQLR
ncbi:MAG: NADH-quinone oxidoreductase subunit C [Chloroflexi bacterium]|nr:NADH-quinone oxidoreductase subunit C [Chloroflexota bacterium]